MGRPTCIQALCRFTHLSHITIKYGVNYSPAQPVGENEDELSIQVLYTVYFK